MTPYEKLRSLPGADGFLKPGVTFEQLDAAAHAVTSLEAGGPAGPQGALPARRQGAEPRSVIGPAAPSARSSRLGGGGPLPARPHQPKIHPSITPHHRTPPRRHPPARSCSYPGWKTLRKGVRGAPVAGKVGGSGGRWTGGRGGRRRVRDWSFFRESGRSGAPPARPGRARPPPLPLSESGSGIAFRRMKPTFRGSPRTRRASAGPRGGRGGEAPRQPLCTHNRRGWDDVRRQGIGVGQVRILSQQATRKFGRETAEQLARLLGRNPDGERINRVAAAMLDCDAPDDFLARVRGR